MGSGCTIVCVLFLICGVVQAFYVNGNTLYDHNGNPTLLRGIARPSLEWNQQGEFISLADYTLMKNWGANVVRLSLNQCYWLGLDGANSAAYKATVEQSVQWIKSLGMSVILDLHWSNGAKAGCYQKKMPDTKSVDFWTEVATKYSNDPVILFELYNEPYTTSWTIWQQGGTETDENVPYTAVGFQTLYNTVRNTGANNVVIISGIYYAYDLSGVPSHPIQGNNIMYNTHPYNTGNDRPISGWDSKFGFITSNYPLIATEFGDFTHCTAQFTLDFINYCNAKSISWTAWGWWVQGCSFPSVIAAWDGTPTAPGEHVRYDLLHTNKVPGNTSIIPTVATFGSATTQTAGTTGTGTGTTGNAGTTGSGTGINTTVYADGLENGFQDFSWANRSNPSDTSQKHQGTMSYSWATGFWKAMYFVKRGAVSTSQYKGVEFWVNGGTSGNQQIVFNVLQAPEGQDSIKKGPDDLYISNYIGGAIPANRWVRGFVDFSQFPSGNWDGIWFQSTAAEAGTVYFDQVVLVAYPPATSSTTSKTTTSQSTTSQSTTTKPTTSQSTTSQSTTSQSTTTKPTTSQATTSQSTTTKPTTTSQTTTSQSTSSQPTTSQSTSSQATTSQSTSSQATSESTSAQPTTSQPTTSESTSSQPTTSQSTTASTKSATTQSVTTAPTVCEPGQLQCPCTAAGGCATDLACVSGRCVDAGDQLRGSASLAFSLFTFAYATFAGIFVLVF